MNNNIEKLLFLAKQAAILAYKKLQELDEANIRYYSISSEIPREFKSKADKIIESILIDELKHSDINILSEESGLLELSNNSALKFIIDPIDGTVNFLRQIANSAISIALFDNEVPIFGVLVSYPSGDIVWGGRDIGSFINGKELKVSLISKLEEAVLCSGFPSRFRFNNDCELAQMKLMSKFAKVRMLGSAAQSLLLLAKGSVDCYSEEEIMLWDVAAGIAIVEGAGGRVTIINSESDYLIKIVADNGNFNHEELKK